MRIGTRLIGGFFVIAALVLFVGILGAISNSRLQESHRVATQITKFVGLSDTMVIQLLQLIQTEDLDDFHVMRLSARSTKKELGALQETMHAEHEDHLQKYFAGHREVIEVFSSISDAMITNHHQKLTTTQASNKRRAKAEESFLVRELGELINLLGESEDQISNAVILKTKLLAKNTFYILLATITIAFIASIALGLYIARSISGPILDLRDAAAEIGRGRLETRIKISSGDEIGDLTGSFNRMADRLKKAADEVKAYSTGLEQKVTERTSELQKEISERKGGEEKIRQINLRLQDTNRHLEASKHALLRSNQELEQFAYVASHDLQEPLRIVASYTGLLAKRYKGRIDSDADEFISFAIDAAKRMQRLISDLLSYSRMGKQEQPLDLVAFEIPLKQALANLREAAAEADAVVTYDPLPKVMADRAQLARLFQNLIGNAIKYRGNKPPEIHVGAKRKDGDWLFSVRDNGIGMEPQYAKRIFILFQRLHNKSEYSGTGIGLTICKKIIERHGGRIWVESELKEGSAFYFTIPATPPPPQTDGISTPGSKPDPSTPPAIPLTGAGADAAASSAASNGENEN